MSDQQQLVPYQPTALEFLQEYYDVMGYKDQIIWDAYNSDQKDHLRKKVIFALGAKEESEGSDKDSMAKHKREMELVDEITNQIWNQAKYTGGMLYMSVSYICVFPEGKTTLADAPNSKDYIVMPLFRIMKCRKEKSAHDCCMIFVDMQGRVYANWEDFRDENILPASIVVAPRRGVFLGTPFGVPDPDQMIQSKDTCIVKKSKCDEDNNERWRVIIEKFLSPAALGAAKAAGYADTASTVTGLASSVVLAGAVFPLTAPFVAPVVGVAAVAGICSGGWSVFRSGQQLHDRNKHEQSISMSNREARGSWLAVFGGGLGIAAGAAGGLLGSLARNGKTISPFIMVGVDTLNISTLVVNGASTLNGVVDIFFFNDESISMIQITQLAASIFFFTHSAYNFKLSKTIVKTHQDMTMRDMRNNLSRNQRRMFDKMSKETIRLKGETAGKTDIIRSMKTISDPKEYFRDIYKINKQLNQAEMKPSFGGDNKVVLNSAPSDATPSEIRSQLKSQPPNQVFQAIPKHDPNLGDSVKPAKLNFAPDPHFDAWVYKIRDAVGLFQGVKHLISDDIVETVRNIARRLNEWTFESFVRFVRAFVDEYGNIIERDIKRLISFDEYLDTLFQIFEKKARELKITIDEFIDDFLVSGYFTSKKQKKLVDDTILSYYRAQEPTIQCSVCHGFYCQ